MDLVIRKFNGQHIALYKNVNDKDIDNAIRGVLKAKRTFQRYNTKNTVILELW